VLQKGKQFLLHPVASVVLLLLDLRTFIY